VFPPIFIHLVASGEASGRLAHMLGQAARQACLADTDRTFNHQVTEAFRAIHYYRVSQGATR
jgi:type II secretory pathway component PulF